MPFEQAKDILREYKLKVIKDNDPYFFDKCVTKYVVDEKKEVVNVYVNDLGEDSFSLDEKVLSVRNLGFVTGRNSINKELFAKRGVGATDLGICVDNHENLLYLYGDSFSGVDCNDGVWNSNFLAVSENKYFSNNVSFSDIVSYPNGLVKPINQGQHDKNDPINLDPKNHKEVTKIPTGGIRIGDEVYIFFMYVRYWGKPGEWFVTKNECLKAKSYDLTHFERVDALSFDNIENDQFGQIYPFDNPFDKEHIYLLALPGGRFGNTVLLRVKKENFENKDKYEILTKKKAFKPLNKVKKEDYFFIVNINGSSEESIVYNPYLKKWIISNLDRDGTIYFLTADSLTEEFKKDIKVLDFPHFVSLYGGFIHPRMMDHDGKRMYFQVSQWSPIYNTSLFEIIFK